MYIFLLFLVSTLPAFAMQWSHSEQTTNPMPGVTITRLTREISGLAIDELKHLLHNTESTIASEYDAAIALPHAQKILELVKKGEGQEKQIYDCLKILSIEQIKQLKPIAGDLKKEAIPTFRNSLHSFLAAQKDEFEIALQEKNKTPKNIGLINYYRIHHPEFLDDPVLKQKLKVMKKLFSFTKIRLQTSLPDYFPEGFYKTDRDWLVEIDHKKVQVGQETKWGKIIAIN